MTDNAQELGAAIAERVRLLVDRRDGGVILAASRRTGVTQSALHRMYHGEVAEPALGNLAKIARAYGVSLNWLVEGGTSHRPPPVRSDGQLGYGDTRADEFVTWLESQPSRRRWSVRERVGMALDEAKGYGPEDFQIIAAWCYLKLLEEEEGKHAAGAPPAER